MNDYILHLVSLWSLLFTREYTLVETNFRCPGKPGQAAAMLWEPPALSREHSSLDALLTAGALGSLLAKWGEHPLRGQVGVGDACTSVRLCRCYALPTTSGGLPDVHQLNSWLSLQKQTVIYEPQMLCSPGKAQ